VREGLEPARAQFLLTPLARCTAREFLTASESSVEAMRADLPLLILRAWEGSRA